MRNTNFRCSNRVCLVQMPSYWAFWPPLSPPPSPKMVGCNSHLVLQEISTVEVGVEGQKVPVWDHIYIYIYIYIHAVNALILSKYPDIMSGQY